jgi:CMP-N,N'-diacetyllegionaminic acid synthase
MNILFTICGRAGSKGLKNKNLSLLSSIPLPIYAIGLIELYRDKYKNHHSDIILSSDSEELHHLLESIKVKNLLRVHRPKNISDDKSAKIDVIKHAYFEAITLTHLKYEFIIDLDITSPIRRLSDLENVIFDHIKSKTAIQLTATESRRNPYFNMVKLDEFNNCTRVIPSNYVTRQECPTVFDLNASIYSYLPSALENRNPSSSNTSCSITLMKDSIILDIDSQNDLSALNHLVEYLLEHDKELKDTFNKAKKLFNNSY